MAINKQIGKFMIANPLLDALPLMTARQQKFLYLALSKLGWGKSENTGKSIRTDKSHFMMIPISEFIEIFADRTRNAESDLMSEVEELHHIIINVKNTDYREFIEKNPECIKPLMEYLYDTGEIPPMEYLAKKEWSFPLVNLIGIGKGAVIIEINKYATPFLCFVTSNFTESNLDIISKLKDKSEIHFYMAMKRLIVKNNIKRSYLYEDIRRITLGGASKQYLSEKNFRSTFLKRVVTNINENTDINLAIYYKSGVYSVSAKMKKNSYNKPLDKINPEQEKFLTDFIQDYNLNNNMM